MRVKWIVCKLYRCSVFVPVPNETLAFVWSEFITMLKSCLLSIVVIEFVYTKWRHRICFCTRFSVGMGFSPVSRSKDRIRKQQTRFFCVSPSQATNQSFAEVRNSRHNPTFTSSYKIQSPRRVSPLVHQHLKRSRSWKAHAAMSNDNKSAHAPL